MREIIIRPYRTDDRAAIGDVCVRTGKAGGDSREIYPDLDLLPSIFAWPYAELEPELTFVADNGERAVGYILGTADTPAFVDAYRRKWLPTLLDRYPPPTAPPAAPEEHMIALMHNPDRMLVRELAGYPAHLHIDLLPDYQRAGHGRALMTAFLGALTAAGVPAVHLGMVTANRGARAFYERLGFREIAVPGTGSEVYLGLRLDQGERDAVEDVVLADE